MRMSRDLLSDKRLRVTVPVIAGFCALYFYDSFFDWFGSFLHAVLGVLHILMEAGEHVLEMGIEHVFHTSPRATEIIAFYIMVASGVLAALRLLRIVADGCRTCYRRLEIYYRFLQARIAAFSSWRRRQTELLKAKPYLCLLISSSFFMIWMMMLN